MQLINWICGTSYISEDGCNKLRGGGKYVYLLEQAQQILWVTLAWSGMSFHKIPIAQKFLRHAGRNGLLTDLAAFFSNPLNK